MSVSFPSASQTGLAWQRQPQYRLGPDGTFHIDEFDCAPAFSSFLPGIAGLDGLPTWCMYVNRGQAVAGFGMDGKDNALMEFLPANWAYQLTPVQGFRTFLRLGDDLFYEPFSPTVPFGPDALTRRLSIEPHTITLTEGNTALGLETRVAYWTLAHRPVPALVRRVEIRNIGGEARRCSLLDGMPVLVAGETTDFMMKKLRRLAEAFVRVRREGDVAIFSPPVRAGDEAEVLPIRWRNFVASFVAADDALEPTLPVVDPDVVFGGGMDLVTPRRFVESGTVDREAQVWENRMPCAFAEASGDLEPGAVLTLYSVIGSMERPAHLEALLAEFRTPAAIEATLEENRALVSDLTRPAFTVSAHDTFDGYARQNFLDNLLRGGKPILFPGRNHEGLSHVYTRRHGDMERDYNDFQLPPHPYSEGQGNFRDILQNRRHFAWFYPEVADRLIALFCELVQADGYNPLTIAGYRWQSPDPEALARKLGGTNEGAVAAFRDVTSRPFAPGVLLRIVDVEGLPVPSGQREVWLRDALLECDCFLVAWGHAGGYWIDHWTYLLDLLEAFEGIHPEQVEDMLAKAGRVGWVDEGAYVVPRTERTVRRPAGVLQLDAVRDVGVHGEALPRVSIGTKLVFLAAIKAVSFDAAGVGIEMEAGRPGWDDALNGLPGQFGSATPEVVALRRLAAWLEGALGEKAIELPADMARLLGEVLGDLDAGAYDYERSCRIREEYRRRVRFEPEAGLKSVSRDEVGRLLRAIVERCDQAIQKARVAESGLLHTFFSNEPESVEEVAPEGLRVRSFRQKPLPLFLEGQVNLMRVVESAEEARRLHGAVRKSGLFDPALQTFKLNEPLTEWPHTIGRVRTFSRGWYENESVWVHMLYKYLLELLRTGLHEEFFAEAQHSLIPFLDPAVYGRSVLETSSFIASSACPDPAARGRGFVARLSGSTAEFIHIWTLMTVGERPFRWEEGELVFEPHPVLPGDWFTTSAKEGRWNGGDVEIPANSFAAAFLGTVLLVYHNEQRRDTFGANAARPARIVVDGRETIGAPALHGKMAEELRRRSVRRLDVWLE